jgi:MoaA/NifB/PqqE/SkfB family radical SAM enzyme
VTDISGRIARRQERIHVAIGPTCNNNCLFCMEEDRASREVVNGAMTPDRVRAILESRRGAEEVCFTSGEPTLVSDLPRYANWAKKLGYRRISVMTNGRRLAHLAYAEHLAKSGVNCFYVSIHGHTARLHTAAVREPEAFEQTAQGIRNVAALKHAGPSGRLGLTLHTSTVVTTRNLAHMKEIYAFLRDLGVDQCVFNVMQANGRAHTHFDLLFPTYAEIASAFKQFLDTCGEPQPQAFLVDIPLCTTTAIPDFHRGYVEKYVHYEPKGFQEIELLTPDAPEQAPDLVAVTRADLDHARRQKRPECAACRYDAACEGVWTNYLARRGWAEFGPVA